MNGRAPRGALALVCAIFLLVSCTRGDSGTSMPVPSTPPGARFTMVALGDGATVPDLPEPAGVRDGWAQYFYVNALPRSATFVNLATRFATAGEALERELPALASLHPRVVAMLFGLDDLNPAEAVTPDQFAANFAAVLDAVIASGAKTIMVATIPDEATGADALNTLVRQAVAERHLTLVDLTPLTLARSPSSSERFIPDAASQRKIAAAFTSAYRKLNR